MSELKDWRGTPIEVGSKVVAHALGKTPNRYIGRVTKLGTDTVQIEVLERDSSWSWGGAKFVTLGHLSVVVLTKGLLDD